MRRAAKRDANEDAIVDALEAIGASVIRLSGRGVPDLLVFHPRYGWHPFEVKTKQGRLTKAQREQRAKTPYTVVRDAEDALGCFGVRP